MHVFIDEAGPFIRPKGREWSVSCVGALAVRDVDVKRLFEEFEGLKASWGHRGVEIKGREVDERQAAAIISLVGQFDVVFEVTALDLALESQEDLDLHRIGQAKKITEHLDSRFHPNLVRQLHELAVKLKTLPSQLYVQAVCSFELLHNVLGKAKLYYVQRYPAELGEFHWFVDAKERTLTPYEDLWRRVILPFLESRSLKDPWPALRGADYSHFEKYCGEMPKPPDRFRGAVGKIRGPFYYFDVKKVLQRLDFRQSDNNLGLQLADILTTSIRRAMNGNLQKSGWGDIGKLMVQSKRPSNAIHMVRLSKRSHSTSGKTRPPYWEVVRLADLDCKQMLPPI